MTTPIQETMEFRRHAVEESLRPITVAELETLSELLFRHFDHPMLEKFLGVIRDPDSGIFHHARAGGRIQVLYCHRKNTGMWYIPGFATGRLGSEELKVMKEVVQAG